MIGLKFKSDLGRKNDLDFLEWGGVFVSGWVSLIEVIKSSLEKI